MHGFGLFLLKCMNAKESGSYETVHHDTTQIQYIRLRGKLHDYTSPAFFVAKPRPALN